MTQAMPIGRAAVPAALLSLALLAPAQAQTFVTSNVNIRSGPGPSYPVIGRITARRGATVIGCVSGSLWCQVDFRGVQGWAYIRNPAIQATARQFVIAEVGTSTTAGLPTLPLPLPTFAPAVTYQAPTVAYQAPATTQVVGDVVTAPARAAFAAVPPLGSTVVTTTPQFTRQVVSTPAREAFAAVPAVTPPATVSNFMLANPLQPVAVQNEIVVGATMPRAVTLQPVPNYSYQYVYANGQPVLVDPVTRQIVFVLR